MEFTKNKISFIQSVMLMVVCFLLPISLSAEENAPKVAFLPFVIHAPADLNYLKDGVRDMLASRLAGGAGVEIIDKNQVESVLAELNDTGKQGNFELIGAKLSAAYLVTGSITSLGGGLSLDTKVINLDKPDDSQNFYSTAAKNDEVIGAVDTLAWDIAEKMFDKKSGRSQEKTVEQAPVAATATENREIAYQTSHPDREFKNNVAVVSGGLVTPAPPAGNTSANMQLTMPKFMKSKNFKFAVTAMDAGDVDGDGEDEILVAEKAKVHVFKRNGQMFSAMGTISIPGRLKIHSLSVADFNKTPGAEIFISAADNNGPFSYVAQWNGKEFSVFIKDAEWYLKTLALPGEGTVLAGQMATMEFALAAGVYRLEIVDGKIEARDQIALPRGVNLFDFAFADIDNDGNNEIVATDQDDRLLVLERGGKLLWRSTERFGGVTRFIGGERDNFDFTITPENPEFRYYISPRIIVKDVNNDGRQDIILNRNHASASRLFDKARSYPDGDISVLSWNGIALSHLWSTGKIDGYIADYQLRPFADGKGAGELFVSVVLQGGWLNKLSADESTVLMFKVGQ